MTTAERERQAERLTATYNNLRQSKFKKGQPFLILSKKLPAGQAYLEHADGKIEIIYTTTKDNQLVQTVVRELNPVEAFRVRAENGLQ
ncbi:hypothetical protein GO495_06815 [Chitinophaga oryziterrae]|uniref:Uncharacterized protein n=1 Tax=Chitinophaga oryziterrae TaxID=1031224 RepID=A0A6N8J4Y3_9BACT|nr:hypothetical protein [Chitinophaga oryziterrae]MVT40287.1 hypothetical protein [Chitinophaga oryziterrae]